MLYHPSHRVPDLSEAEQFFDRVFGRTSFRLSSLSPSSKRSERAAADYCSFTPIADVLFDSIEPRRYVVGGEQRYPDVDRPTLEGLGWYVEDITSLYRALREHGVRVLDQLDRVAVGDDPPTAVGSPMPLFFTEAADAGLRYEFLPRIPFPIDRRLDDGWTLPPVSDDDPLGIVRCSHHVVLTDRPDRALRLVVDVLGGTIVHEGRDEELRARTVSVHLADAIIQYAVPDGGTAAREELSAVASRDSYHSIAWLVVDLDRTESHLRAHGVGISTRTDSLIVVEASSALGIPWQFTTAAVPDDPRAQHGRRVIDGTPRTGIR